MNPFRKKHLDQIFPLLEEETGPLDLFLGRYFRQNRALGSKDRKYIGETLYQLMRHKRLLDQFIKEKINWKNRFEVFLEKSIEELKKQTEKPDVQSSCPEVLFRHLKNDWGEKKALEIAHLSNLRAPMTIRVNTLKKDRDAFLETLEKEFSVKKTDFSDTGIQFLERAPIFQHPSFKDGYFEMQDEASQLLADLVEVKPGQKVLDFCSGSGGKALAIAPHMQGKGVVYLHDIRPGILAQAKKRLKRAGVQNAQVHLAGSKQLNGLKGNIDWVLVDAPCSGSGTYKRNPDLKWKFNEEMLSELQQKQAEIFSNATKYLKPGAHIVYATCSLLKAENEDQVERFIQQFPHLQLVKTFSSLDKFEHMDGFFGALFKFVKDK